MRIFQESPCVNGGNRFIFQESCSNFFSRATDNGLKTIQTDKNLDRYIDRLSADSRPIYRTAIFWLSTECRPTINWVSTNYWLIHRSSIDQLSVKCRRNVSEVSAKCRWKVGEVSVNEKLYRPRHIWNDYRPCLDRVSTDYWPTIDRVSTEYRPTVDRVSTNYRPTVNRYIDRYIDRYLGGHYPQ